MPYSLKTRSGEGAITGGTNAYQTAGGTFKAVARPDIQPPVSDYTTCPPFLPTSMRVMEHPLMPLTARSAVQSSWVPPVPLVWKQGRQRPR